MTLISAGQKEIEDFHPLITMALKKRTLLVEGFSRNDIRKMSRYQFEFEYNMIILWRKMHGRG